MGDGTVRPAVAVLAYHALRHGRTHTYASTVYESLAHGDWRATLVDGDAAQIAARVRLAIWDSNCGMEWSPEAAHTTDAEITNRITARVLRALGIPTEATTDGK
jgi:hypothetical protein